MNHLMVDLETMGNGPYAPVISIGAVFFDPNTGETGEEFSVNISLESSMRYRARPDASTILWWLEQSEEARKSLTSNTQELSTALSWLSEFIIKNANHKFVQVSLNISARACVITAHVMALSVMTEEFTMRGLAYNPGILPAEMIIRQRVKPMPSREELLKRKSFGSVNDNRYLNATWRKGGNQ